MRRILVYGSALALGFGLFVAPAHQSFDDSQFFDENVSVGAPALAQATGTAAAQRKPALRIKPANNGRPITPRQLASDKKIGAAEHAKLLAEFGGAYKDDALAGYVAQIGGRMAANSELPAAEFTFTLLNSRTVNAFALPGGYVYISRQLLALMNDEAELASVLGHETGHVTDRHTARRIGQAQTGSIATIIAGLGVGLLTGSSQIGELAARMVGTGAQLYTLSYSRNQEFRADELGMSYMEKAGYDTYAAADMLDTLGAHTQLDARLMGQDAERIPTWARTHPLTQDRVVRAAQLARGLGQQPGVGVRNRDAFLQRLDGMIFDDDPEQGFIRECTFAHPKLMLTFSVPQQFTIVDNTASAVDIQGPDGAGVQFSGVPLRADQSLENSLRQAWRALAQDAPYALGTPVARVFNGMEALISSGRVNAGQGNLVDIMLVAYRWSPTSSYVFTILTPAARTAELRAGLQGMLGSLRRLSEQEAGALVERRVRVISVKPGDTSARLAERMAYDSAKLERFLTLNAIAADAPLVPGQKVKLIVYAKK
jgi:predicted Zn-dependent protease